MRFKEVIVRNIGLFKGKQVVNLVSSKQKNIILFGGQNGNGKTTLFESIRLCLYGGKILNSNSIKKYHSFLKSLLHHSETGEIERDAEVIISFDHILSGKLSSFEIKRHWELNDKDKIIETFEVKENGNLLSNMDSDTWEDFINSLIPFGLSKLFFFDGEKIQELAEDKEDNQEFIDSFKLMLGVDLVERLQIDLETYSVQQAKEVGSKELNERLSVVELEIDKLQQEIDDVLQNKSKIQSDIDSLFLNIEKNESKLRNEGGVFATKRDELINEYNKLENKLELEQDNIRAMSQGILPFILSPKLNNKLKKRLFDEEANSTKQKVIDYLKSGGAELKYLLKNAGVDENSLVNKLEKDLSQNISQNVIHNINIKESFKIINYIEQLDPVKEEFIRKIQYIKQIERRLFKLNTQIKFAPSESVIEPFLKKLNELHENVNFKKSELEKINEELKIVSLKVDKEIRQKEIIIKILKETKSAVYRFELIQKVKEVLVEFYEEHKKQKLDLFSKEFLISYETISRKKNVFEKIIVNPRTFEVSLFKKGGREIKKSQLSAGERQIYAISVLWTLTKISKRDLPFIIDTPLGRLDGDHRTNLISNFFTKASDQVIILSTDTEVTEDYYKKLEPKIAKSYVFNYTTGQSKIKEGYFWN